jgi:hypothetical protein
MLRNTRFIFVAWHTLAIKISPYVIQADIDLFFVV